jgi:hypothetical protein
VVLDIGMMAVSDIQSFRTGKIPVDEGQTSWRAARLLWHGEDPYGAGTIADINAYRARAAERAAAGIATPLPEAAIGAALARYDATLDPAIGRALLPPGTRPGAARERRLSGYKYGPVLLLVTALAAPLGIPAAVMVLNGLACFGLYGLVWRILGRIAGPERALAGAAMLALLLDRHITRSYFNQSTTDVWSLLFGAAAVLACLSRRPLAMAAAIAFAVGAKIMPGLLFTPLLLRFRTPWPLAGFVVLLGAIYLPWLLWDWQGVVYNVLLWPVLMAKGSGSWEFFAPPWAAWLARVVGVCALTALWLRCLLGIERRLFWTLAVSANIVLLATGYLTNNYIPWLSIWAVSALVEAFAAGGEEAARAA